MANKKLSKLSYALQIDAIALLQLPETFILLWRRRILTGWNHYPLNISLLKLHNESADFVRLQFTVNHQP